MIIKISYEYYESLDTIVSNDSQLTSAEMMLPPFS